MPLFFFTATQKIAIYGKKHLDFRYSGCKSKEYKKNKTRIKIRSVFLDIPAMNLGHK